jgi:hypothetical protein
MCNTKKTSKKRRIIMLSNFKKSKWTKTALAIILVSSIGLAGCSQSANDNTADLPAPTKNPTITEPAPSTTPPAPEASEKAYYGQWVISKVQASGIGTYSNDSANSLIGKSLSFTSDKANYFGDEPSVIEKVAANPIYTETIIKESDFAVNYRIPLDNLGIETDTVTEISVSDLNGYVCTFFIKDENTIILSGGGTYFEAVRKNL